MEAKAPVRGQKNICFCVMSKAKKKKFHYFKGLYQNNKFDVLLKEKESVYWLKLRSIARKPLLLEFCNLSGIDCSGFTGEKLFEHLYTQQSKVKLLDKFIAEKYAQDRRTRKSEEEKLISELYKLQVFDWGGLYQNALERTIVNNYVKKIRSFTLLSKKIEGEIHQSMRGYVLSSWFNHWTSILIEDIFKDHKKVTATVGLMKKIDFFIDDIPFDLKVTYFPDGFMQLKRKELGLQTEFQELRNFALKNAVKFDCTRKDKIIFMELVARFKESIHPKVKQFWSQFNSTRRKIIKTVMRRPETLIRWLYEQQGERRFDAANRLFIVLVDQNNLDESWKMKRNVELLTYRVNNYLNKLSLKNVKKHKIVFNWKDGKKYSALSDILFIMKK